MNSLPEAAYRACLSRQEQPVPAAPRDQPANSETCRFSAGFNSICASAPRLRIHASSFTRRYIEPCHTQRSARADDDHIHAARRSQCCGIRYETTCTVGASEMLATCSRSVVSGVCRTLAACGFSAVAASAPIPSPCQSCHASKRRPEHVYTTGKPA